MKLSNFAYLASAAIIAAASLASCSGDNDSKTVRPLSDYKNLTTGDSVAYYVGQLSSLSYWRAANQDTTLQTRESRDQYLKGLRAGYEAIRDNEAYNQGYYMGMQLAMQLKEFNEEYGTSTNKQVLFNAIEDGLINDSIVDISEAQMNFTRLNDELNARKEAEDKVKALEALAKDAAANGWTKINDTLYASAAQGGQGNVLRIGDKANVSLSIFTMAGREIDRRQNPDTEIGKGFPGAIGDALQTMKIGESRSFYTYAQALFGRLFARYGLKSTDIVEIRISVAAPEAKSAAGDEQSQD
ncbi:MAG: hypothetical protein K2I48_08070 [Muribaculaceae bacterium]|nr:hypothetical protein [Muribaculaceae bacterium]